MFSYLPYKSILTVQIGLDITLHKTSLTGIPRESLTHTGIPRWFDVVIYIHNSKSYEVSVGMF
jgi:hypothetical protein